MAKRLTIPEIIDLWPRQEDLASDCAVERVAVTKWRSRGRIPPEYYKPMLESAKAHGVPLTGDMLANAKVVPADRREKNVKTGAA